MESENTLLMDTKAPPAKRSRMFWVSVACMAFIVTVAATVAVVLHATYIPHADVLLRKIEHISMKVPDVEEARAWYGKMFGLFPKECDDVVVECTPYVQNVMNVRVALLGLREGEVWTPPVLQSMTGTHVAFELRNMEFYNELRGKFVSENVTIFDEVFHTNENAQAMYIEDLNGYSLELFTYT